MNTSKTDLAASSRLKAVAVLNAGFATTRISGIRGINIIAH
jgi:hypothetical protein